jgi:hypothetical protein
VRSRPRARRRWFDEEPDHGGRAFAFGDGARCRRELADRGRRRVVDLEHDHARGKKRIGERSDEYAIGRRDDDARGLRARCAAKRDIDEQCYPDARHTDTLHHRCQQFLPTDRWCRATITACSYES